MTTGTRCTRAPAGAFGAPSMGPAKAIVEPSRTTQPFRIGSPRPGIKRSASMRSMMDGNASGGMRILGGSAPPTESEDKPFRHAPVPRAGRDHGPREEPVELSSGGETHYRRPPVLRSDRFGGLRPS